MKTFVKTSRVRTAFFAACVVLACFSALANTMRMALLMDVKNHQSRATFEPSKDHPGEEWLYLTQAHDDVEFEMRLSMSGQKEQVQKGRTNVDEVPGVTQGVTGYKRAKVETFGNEPTLIIETKLVRKKQQDGKEVEEKEESLQRLPLQFKSKSATLEDLKAGKTVEFQITKAGLKNLVQQAKTKTEAGMNVKAEGEGAKVSISSSVGFLDSSHKGVVFISARKIQYEAPPMRVHAEGKLRVSGAEFK
ncbi:MAG TPA: hypothetical protein VNZ22_05550 [Bacillota bacterium]|nr:hypothetical protein [Bacillota bacterium]